MVIWIRLIWDRYKKLLTNHYTGYKQRAHTTNTLWTNHQHGKTDHNIKLYGVC